MRKAPWQPWSRPLQEGSPSPTSPALPLLPTEACASHFLCALSPPSLHSHLLLGLPPATSCPSYPHQSQDSCPNKLLPGSRCSLRGQTCTWPQPFRSGALLVPNPPIPMVGSSFPFSKAFVLWGLSRAIPAACTWPGSPSTTLRVFSAQLIKTYFLDFSDSLPTHTR